VQNTLKLITFTETISGVMKNAFLLLFLFMFSCRQERLNLLVYSATTGYRHESIASGVKMIGELAGKRNWEVTFTEEPGFFSSENLRDVDVVVFLNTSGNVLDSAQQLAFEAFLRKGKGFVGIHGAADTEYENPFYRSVNGALFRVHPPAQEAVIRLEKSDHPAMKPFRGMEEFRAFDEWYSFDEKPGGDFVVLATLDESSILKAEDDSWKMGDHPVIWWREKEGIRSLYTVFGHTHEAFSNPVLVGHFAEAIDWAGFR